MLDGWRRNTMSRCYPETPLVNLLLTPALLKGDCSRVSRANALEWHSEWLGRLLMRSPICLKHWRFWGWEGYCSREEHPLYGPSFRTIS